MKNNQSIQISCSRPEHYHDGDGDDEDDNEE